MSRRSRLTRAEREPLEYEARAILRLYVDRIDQEAGSHSIGSSMTAVRDALLRGFVAERTAESRSHLTDRQQWIIDVYWVLQEIGGIGGDILIARLTPREKSPESAWPVVTGCINEAHSTCLIQDEVVALYDESLPAFMDVLRRRDIGRDYRRHSSISEKYRNHAPAASAA
jgi:hypothetical protein